MKNIIVRNKNVLVELLEDNASFEKINLASGLDQDIQTQKIIKLATKQRIPIEELSRYKMEKRRGSDTTEAISGLLRVENNWTLKNLLDDIYKKDQDPFFLFINRIEFPTNIGMIARTAFALGVNGLFFQGKENLFFNEETFHFSMGAIARIPLVKVGIFEALKELQKNGIKIFSIQMGGDVYFEEDLLGPIAFVLGDEKAGVSETISDRCDGKISIPMKKGIDSLNVGISASIILSEKVRQESFNFLNKQAPR